VGFGGCFQLDSPERVDVNVDAMSMLDGGRSRGGRTPALADAGDALHGGRRGTTFDQLADVAGSIIGQGRSGCIFFGYDVLAPPNTRVELLVRIRAYRRDINPAGLRIAFRRLEDGQLIGSARTDRDGYASVDYTPAGTGDVPVLARVVGVDDPSRQELLHLPNALLLVAVRKRDEPFVVIDLDHTLVDSSFMRVVLWDGGRPMVGSQPVMQRIAERFSVIYLTHRPRDLTRRSRRWLIENGYPPGVLLLSRARQAIGDAAEYKTQALRDVRKNFRNLQYGVGDKVSDVEAYLANDMRACWIPHYDHDDAEDIQQMARQVYAWRDTRGLWVCENWRQIESAIFDGRAPRPMDFVKMLDRRARRQRRIDRDD
jgi:hypothetical protein